MGGAEDERRGSVVRWTESVLSRAWVILPGKLERPRNKGFPKEHLRSDMKVQAALYYSAEKSGSKKRGGQKMRRPLRPVIRIAHTDTRLGSFHGPAASRPTYTEAIPTSSHVLSMSRWHWPIALLVVVAIIGLPAVDARECQREDFIGAETACVNGRKNIIYYQNPDSQCTGTTNKPDNLFNIACGTGCELEL